MSNSTNEMSASVNARTDWSTRCWATGPATAPIKKRAVLSVYEDCEYMRRIRFEKQHTAAGTPVWSKVRSVGTGIDKVLSQMLGQEDERD